MKVDSVSKSCACVAVPLKSVQVLPAVGMRLVRLSWLDPPNRHGQLCEDMKKRELGRGGLASGTKFGRGDAEARRRPTKNIHRRGHERAQEEGKMRGELKTESVFRTAH